MRSLAFTLVLALLAAAGCMVIHWQSTGGNLDDLLGPPPVPVGQRIYSSFAASEVRRIQVSQNGITAVLKLGDRGWESMTPWKDRVDPRLAVGIINFTLNMRVEDFADTDDIDPQTAGLGESRINIRLDDKDHRQLARYRLGRQTPWLATFPDLEDPVPTVFVQRHDENQKRYIYACTGDIGSMFKDGMIRLRDHHPFYFNPLTVRQLHLRTGQNEFTLNRESPEIPEIPEIPATATHPGQKSQPGVPGSPWRVTMPLELATDKTAVKSLLEGLYQLQAVRVSDLPTASLPTSGVQAKSDLISMKFFGSDTETTLEIFPPELPTSTTVRAIVSDRPGTVFELPLKSESDQIALSDLPRQVNEVRDAMLTNIRKESFDLLRQMIIHPQSGSEIVLTRTPPQRWMVTIDGETQEANEGRLYALLKAATESRVSGFESDAVTDLSPWGLDNPMLTLSFIPTDETQTIRLNFGTDGKGNYFVNRQGSPTVMRVDSDLLSSIPMRAFEWRQSRIWSVDRLHLLALSRKFADRPPLAMLYDFNQETWTANQDSHDVTARLNPARANYLLGILEGLKVTRWLSPEDPSAKEALRTPSLAFKVLEDQTDEKGDVIGRITRELWLSPSTPGNSPPFYYGLLGGDTQPFMLDRDTYSKLATELLEQP